MKLLITTQAVDIDDPNLGFFHRWLEEFSRSCEKVTVICLREGRHRLPPNVQVYSLGKEKGSKNKLIYAWLFVRYIVRMKPQFDAVFVHMNPEYAILGGIFFRLWKKKLGLWYTHKSVDLKLRVAVFFANVVFTASPESFRLNSSKVIVAGHGIDTAHNQARFVEGPLRVYSAGRISKTKRILEMLQACAELKKRNIPFIYTLVGAPSTPQDHIYEKEAKDMIRALGLESSVVYAGPLSHAENLQLLSFQHVFVNLSSTGSLDKAVLEALSAGIPAVSSNEAYRTLLEHRGLYIKATDPNSIVEAILCARETDTKELKAHVADNHALKNLIPKILSTLS